MIGGVPDVEFDMPLFKRRPKPIALESVDQLEELSRSGKPVLVDFMQYGCSPCQVMDGIVNELAEEYDGSAHVVKANAAVVPGAFERFKVRSTPTFVLLTGSESGTTFTQRWRASGLVKKDVLTGHLESAGATPAAD
jgi:thioredoxin 1